MSSRRAASAGRIRCCEAYRLPRQPRLWPCTTGHGLLLVASLIEACFAAAEDTGAAVAAVPLKDTIKMVSDGMWVSATVDRSRLWAAQTPQAFRTELLVRAYEDAQGEVTDEASAVESLGHPVRIVPGESTNLKLTTGDDLILAEALARGSGW